MQDVFISYKSEERAYANRVRSALAYNGISCWMAPESIGAGGEYPSEIPKGIRQCPIFLLLLSPMAQKSKWIPREIDMAISAERIIIPFMIKDCQLGDAFSFYLSQTQMRCMDEKNPDASIQELAEEIRSKLQKRDADIQKFGEKVKATFQAKSQAGTQPKPQTPPPQKVNTQASFKAQPPQKDKAQTQQKVKPQASFEPQTKTQPGQEKKTPPAKKVSSQQTDDCKYAKWYSLKHPFMATVLSPHGVAGISAMLFKLSDSTQFVNILILSASLVMFGIWILVWTCFVKYKTKVEQKAAYEEILKSKERAQSVTQTISVVSIIVFVITWIVSK